MCRDKLPGYPKRSDKLSAECGEVGLVQYTGGVYARSIIRGVWLSCWISKLTSGSTTLNSRIISDLGTLTNSLKEPPEGEGGETDGATIAGCVYSICPGNVAGFWLSNGFQRGGSVPMSASLLRWLYLVWIGDGKGWCCSSNVFWGLSPFADSGSVHGMFECVKYVVRKRSSKENLHEAELRWVLYQVVVLGGLLSFVAGGGGLMISVSTGPDTIDRGSIYVLSQGLGLQIRNRNIWSELPNRAACMTTAMKVHGKIDPKLWFIPFICT